MDQGWVSALILGAGQARRMGQPKQLLPWGATTLLGKVVENVLASQVQETILVLGHEAPAILQALGLSPGAPIPHLPAGEVGGGRLRLKILMNPDYPEGLSASIRLGVSSLDPRAEAVMIVLGDQPLIDPATMDSLIAAFWESGRGIVAPVYWGKRGHPILLHLKYREAMLGLRGDVGCREILSAHAEDLLGVEVDCPGVLQDIDTPEAYRHGREGLGRDSAGRS